MIDDRHDEFAATVIVVVREHRHEGINRRRRIVRIGGKVSGGRAADEGAVRVRASVLVADLNLVLLLQSTTSLDLTRLEPDGGGVEPDGYVGEVLALGRECNLVGDDELERVAGRHLVGGDELVRVAGRHLVGGDELVRVVRRHSGHVAPGACHVLGERDFPRHYLVRDSVGVSEVHLGQLEIALLQDHAQFAMERMGRGEYIVAMILRGWIGPLVLAPHVTNDAQFFETGQLLVWSMDVVPAHPGEDGNALVRNKSVGIEPVPLGIACGGGGGGDSTTKFPGLGRTAIFPYALGN